MNFGESFKCKKCQKDFFDEEKAGAENSICGICRGKKECEECSRWVNETNKKGLCDDCIPRYIQYSSVAEAMEHEIISDYYLGITPNDRISFLTDVIEEILERLPISDKYAVLTYQKRKNDVTHLEKFVKDEDKIVEE